MTLGEGAAPILLAGPTASGKSALALALAERVGGLVINADSQQVYAGWRILSARPGPEEEARAPHRMYGHVALETVYSTGAWVRDCAVALREAQGSGRRAIIVGGTGLYFKALTEGIAPIPTVPAALRRAGEAALERDGLVEFARHLAARDPETAAVIDLANPMRVLRAWEVLEHSGVGLAAWRARTGPPVLPSGEAVRLAVVPPRARLYGHCEARFDAMMAAGALEEVRAVMALGLPAHAPGLKAVGAPELAAHLRGEIGLPEAVAAAKTATRRYAKRQLTWVRNQMADWQPIAEPISADTAQAVADALLPSR